VSDGASRKLILSHSAFVKIGTRITWQIAFSNIVNFDTDRFFKIIQLPENRLCFKKGKALSISFKTKTILWGAPFHSLQQASVSKLNWKKRCEKAGHYWVHHLDKEEALLGAK
jgi:hypothetical protein